MKTFFFLNILPPYRIGLYNRISKELDGKVKFYFDSVSERNRKWKSFGDEVEFSYEIIDSPSLKLNSKVSNMTKLSRTVYFPFKILRICFKEKPEVIVSLEMGWRTIFCLIYSRIFGKRIYLLSEVTPYTEKKIFFLKKMLRKIICKQCDGGIAQGKLSHDYLNGLGLIKNKIITSPYSIDNSFFINESRKYDKSFLREKFEIDKEKFIFLFVGQFIHRKGIDLLISVFEELAINNKNDELIILLVGGSESELQEIIGSFDETLIKIISFKQKEEIVSYYLISDCFIFPSRFDTWGVVVNEAIACGLPVAVSKYAGCSEDLIEDEINGYVFDPLDKNSFLSTLKKCVSDRDKLKSFAKKAKEKLKIYNHEIAAEKIIDFIKR